MSGAMSPEAETIIRQTETINRLMGQSASRIDQVQRSLDSAYAAQQRFEQAQNTITAAVERGRISQERANQLLDLARQRYQQTGQAATQFAVANDNAARGSRNFGSIIGQAGFQVQDFAVQVASGQSAMTAFVQQGSQLAGVFGPGGAILGAGLAIAGVVVALLNARDATAQFREALDQAGAVYERNTNIATRWREGLQEENNRVRDLTSAYENMNTAQREYERRRLMETQGTLRTQQQGLERNTERELQDLRRVLDRQIAAAREATFRARQLDRNAAPVEVPPDLRAAVGALSQLGEPGQRTAESVAEVARRLAEAGANAGPFAEILNDTARALDALIPNWRQLSESVERNRRDLTANEEAARRAGEGLGAMGANASGAAARVDSLTDAVARLQARTNTLVGVENADAIRRAEERAQALGRGLGAAREFDARQAQAESADRYFREQRRQDEERLRTERYSNDQIRDEITRTDETRRQSANRRAELEAQNQRRLQELEEQDRARRRGATAGARDARREERLTERALRERNQLIGSLDEEAAANFRLEESLRRIEEARRRNLLSEQEAADLSQRVRDRREQEIMRANDKSDMYADETKRLAQLNSELGEILGGAFSDMVREGKSFEDTLKNIEQRLLRLGDKYLLQPLLDQLAQMAMYQLGMGGGQGGGGGGVGGFLSSLLGGGSQLGGEVLAGGAQKGIEAAATWAMSAAVLHDGGIAGGRSVPTRAVPAEVFLDAPRYHSGGYAGRMPFASDEVPAVLRRGEMVLTKRQQETVAQRSGGVTVVNNITTPSVGDFRASGAQISADMARATQRAFARNR